MRRKLGEILVANGAVSLADVDAALADQSAGEPNRLGDLLVSTGKISASQLAQGLAEQYELPFVELPPLPQAVLDLVPLELQRQYRFVPLRSEGTELSIAMADLSNVEVLVLLEQSWTKVHVHVASGEEIDALHATVSGIFKPPDLPAVAPAITPLGSIDDLFASLDDAPAPPIIAPVTVSESPRPSPAPPRAEDLFGDLNLESARTGIAAQTPEATALVKANEPRIELDGAPLIAEPSPELEPLPPPVVEAAPEAEALLAAEGNAPVPLKEGTGPLLDLVAEMAVGTGPIVDTPFFGSPSLEGGVAPPPDRPFSSPSAIARLAHEPIAAPLPEAAAQPSDALPDWLSTGSPSVMSTPSGVQPMPEAIAEPFGAKEWTGALDHLAPSKLVLGLTRALLARGIVTEADILAALGQKK